MNELIQADLQTLVDEVDETQRPLVAAMMDLVEQYEKGNFTSGWGEIIDPALYPTMTPKALICLMRIYRYCNELLRVEISRVQRDSQSEGDSK